MSEFLSKLFSSDFMPHGTCYLWNSPVLWLNVISDGAISLAYYSIPLLLIAFFRRRKDLPLRWVFVAFAAFIVACGTTHVMSIWTVWHGTYRLDGAIKAITALASVVTAALLVPLLPALVSISSPAEVAKVKQDLAHSEEQYRLLFESNPQAMWVYDIETLRFLAVNTSAIGNYGYSREEFLAMTLKDIRPVDQIPALLESVAKNPAGIESSGEWLHRRKDGTLRNARITSHPSVFSGRQARLVLVTDVTEHKKLEERFRHAQKMEAVGLLAGGVSHDFNNLLTAVGGYSQMLLEQLDPLGTLHRYALQIKEATERGGRLTRQLLAFSRQQVMVPTILDLNALVTGVNGMLRRLIGENIQIVIIRAEGLGRVRADRGQIDQVILNLSVNARDAMPDGGRLTIETANVHLEDQDIDTGVHADARPGPYVMLSVTDTGTGMDEKTRAHIFEPFFTTKGAGKGTGLGLSTVYGIVEQSGGHIGLYSEPGRGSTFKIYLPRVEAALEEKRVSGSRPAPGVALGGNETILVVEDDDMVRTFVLRILGSKGYCVLEARNGVEAISVARGRTGPLHLILTDVVMPELGGRDAAATLVAEREGLKVLYMSGYTNDVAVLRELHDASVAYIQKPFGPEVLVRTVRSVLDAGPGHRIYPQD